MSTIPINLNFFKSAEQYLELRKLDKQYEEQIKDYNIREALRDGTGANLNLPTWSLEKKILHWAYLKHKHLGSVINTGLLLNKEFLEDIKSNETEVKFCGAQETIDNLIAHNFARSLNGGAALTPEGLFASVLVYKLYFFSKRILKDKDKKLIQEYSYLYPRFLKNAAYHIVYLVAWLLILDSINLLVLELLNLSGLIDNLKSVLINLEIPISIYLFLAFSPVLLLTISIMIIIYPNFMETE